MLAPWRRIRFASSLLAPLLAFLSSSSVSGSTPGFTGWDFLTQTVPLSSSSLCGPNVGSQTTRLAQAREAKQGDVSWGGGEGTHAAAEDLGHGLACRYRLALGVLQHGRRRRWGLGRDGRQNAPVDPSVAAKTGIGCTLTALVPTPIGCGNATVAVQVSADN